MEFTVKTEQKQTVSNKIIQSSTILQMTSTQLEQYLNEQVMENPVLELTCSQHDEQKCHSSETYDWISSHDEQNLYLYQHLESRENEYPEWNFHQPSSETLAEHLWNQLLTRSCPMEQEKPLRFLLNSLDENGYFTDSLEEFAQLFDLNSEQALGILTLVQSLEPAGIGARNLEECLCLQLERTGELTPQLKDFIHDNLTQIAGNQLSAISRAGKIPMNTVKLWCERIRQLDPKPGLPFSHSRQPDYIIPDVIVTTDQHHMDVSLNEYIYPDISISNYYLNLYQDSSDQEVRNYLQQKIRQAQWVQQCVKQRSATLLSVAKTILSMQQDFIFLGPEHLKPLKQSDIASVLGIHVSTVSRACSNKFLQCSWGTFPLNAFFVKAAPAGGHDGAFPASSTALDVKKALSDLIQQEDKSKPYSDRILAELLNSRGFSISRRTVTKYREELSIPGTSGRKNYN
ncbi:MAG: RNA polymerase factor sigma-54 [Lachnospiraceae bacterium]